MSKIKKFYDKETLLPDINIRVLMQLSVTPDGPEAQNILA
jgi:hypothetical protein